MRLIVHRVVLMRIAAAAIGGTSVLCGCSSSRPVEVTYRFENVRTIGTLDEWSRIKDVLDESAEAPVVGRVTAEKANIGGTHVRDYEATFTVESFEELDQIESGLRDLGDEEFTGGERVQFSLSGVTADYRSTFVATAIEVMIRGVTTPRAVVLLYPTPKSVPLIVGADGRGRFSAKLPSLPSDRAIYGYSQPAGSAPGVGRKYFRIDTVTQRQETLTEGQFFDVVPRPDAPKK